MILAVVTEKHILGWTTRIEVNSAQSTIRSRRVGLDSSRGDGQLFGRQRTEKVCHRGGDKFSVELIGHRIDPGDILDPVSKSELPELSDTSGQIVDCYTIISLLLIRTMTSYSSRIVRTRYIDLTKYWRGVAKCASRDYS